MRHRVAGRKLGRTGEHRLALMRNLSTALLDKEKITTTLAKAKELRGFAEKLVTLSKRETLHARRQVMRHIHDREVVAKLFDTLSARYAQRPGGYTRVIKLGPRRGDNAEMAVIELVGSDESREPKKGKKKGKTKAKAKPAAAAKQAGSDQEAAQQPAKKKAKKKSSKSATKSTKKTTKKTTTKKTVKKAAAKKKTSKD